MDFINIMDKDFDKKVEIAMQEESDACQECEKMRPLAMAYVPMQRWGMTYDSTMALKRGTIFPDLDFPFIGEEVSDK